METLVRFTPEGKPHGFRQKLPEDEPGASLSREEAQGIAETAAVEAWGIAMDRYEIVETSQEVRPGGRTDHTFVYRRREERIGEGEYRLRLVVGGDGLTELTHFVNVPEAFSRRYEEMRSANNGIAAFAGVAVIVLYLVGGCFVGLFYLLRHRWVVWRQPVFWGFSVSFLQALATLNQWPLLWMDYDTALSAGNFVLRQATLILASFLGMGVLLSLSFMAAEGLSRRAFPSHIQLWRLWSTNVASTPAVAGRTVAGYLIVSMFFAYEVGLYFVSRHVLGWWSPSEALFNPDVLSAYFPWLSSVAVSLQAGFWEECMFRAIPIAGAALIGDRLGHRRAWIIGAFVVQALVFGAGHANYPAQPAYARLVELIIPSIGFGLLYLRFGLLTSIVLHFAYDVVWFALPLFVSQAPGVWTDQLMVVLLTLFPLWVVLGARRRSKRWQPLGEDALNRSWRPAVEPPKEEAPAAVERLVAPTMTKRVATAAGVLGLAGWVAFADFGTDAPALRIGRGEAIERAREELIARNIELTDSWRSLTAVRAGVGEGDRFVWQEGGEAAYKQLLGSYLPPPHWSLRFAQFEGDVAERAEEYRVSIGLDGELVRYRHLLPEARSGASLDEEEARRRTLAALTERYDLQGANLEEIAATPSQQLNRVDWQFTFADRRSYPLEE